MRSVNFSSNNLAVQWQYVKRNLNSHIRYKAKHRKSMMSLARSIYKASTKRQSIKRFERSCQRWQDIEHYAVKCFKDGFFDTLHYFEFSEDKNLIALAKAGER